MDSKAASSGSMSSKKTFKSVFHGPANGFFSQKKKTSLGNVKYSGDEKDISLKSGSSASVYSDVESLSGDDEDVSMSGGFNDSLLDSAVNTPKAKRVNTSVNFGSLIGSSDFEIDEKVKPFLPPLMKKIPLDKIWIDPKIIKTPIEMAVKKSFALDINLSAIESKSVMAKTYLIRKESMKKAVSLAEEERIVINNDVRKQGFRSDQAVVIKEISMDTPKEIIVIAVSEFGQIKLIKIQLVGMWQKAVVEFAKSGQAEQLASKWSFLIEKDSVRVAKAMRDCNIWVSRDHFRTLLFTLLVGTTTHDLSNLLDKTGGRTCIINRLLNTGNRVCCAVVGFKFENDLNSAFLTEPVFGGVRLSWARLDLVRCEKYGRLGHSALECDASDMSSSDLLNNFNKRHAPSLAKLYVKKNVPISHPAAFGGKLWAQIVSFASFSGGSPSGFGLGTGSSHHTTPDLGGGPPFFTLADSSLNACLASLKCSLELLTNQVSDILRKLSFVELVPLFWLDLCLWPLVWILIWLWMVNWHHLITIFQVLIWVVASIQVVRRF
ncbi:hypothetical protein G9A89_002835 [Geosiphon pyriformis]|nr:hypothetical protein G9A89_002835 [Geosiphon pyriformis]